MIIYNHMLLEGLMHYPPNPRTHLTSLASFCMLLFLTSLVVEEDLLTTRFLHKQKVRLGLKRCLWTLVPKRRCTLWFTIKLCRLFALQWLRCWFDRPNCSAKSELRRSNFFVGSTDSRLSARFGHFLEINNYFHTRGV